MTAHIGEDAAAPRPIRRIVGLVPPFRLPVFRQRSAVHRRVADRLSVGDQGNLEPAIAPSRRRRSKRVFLGDLQTKQMAGKGLPLPAIPLVLCDPWAGSEHSYRETRRARVWFPRCVCKFDRRYSVFGIGPVGAHVKVEVALLVRA